MGIVSAIEEKVGAMVEDIPFMKKEAAPESIAIAVKRALTANKRGLFGKIFVPNQVSVIVSDKWLKEWAALLPRLKAYLVNDLLVWMGENGYECSNFLALDFETGLLEGKSFDVRVAYVRSPEQILAESPETVLATLRNQRNGELIVICAAETIIGREKGKDHVCIDDPSVSGRHASVSIKAGRFFIEDLGSANATRVNRELVTTRKKLKDGDRVAFGDTLWTLSMQLGK